MRNLMLVTLMILMALLARTGFAASTQPGQTVTNTTYDSTSVTNVTTTARLFCYQYSMNGQPITNTVTSNNPAFDASQCITIPYSQTMFIVGMIGGGALDFTCPSDHPYFNDRRQTWEFVASGNVTAGTDAQCCALPNYTATGTAGWITPDTPGVCP